jgi:RimJ/RimL family protein N-acetyltransferase
MYKTCPVEPQIRRPVPSDATAMGFAHVRAWQAAYRSVMPDEYLDDLSVEDRASMWKRQIEARGGTGLLVAVADAEVVGFAAFGPCAQPQADTRIGQLYAMNIDPDHWGQGLGRKLLRAATLQLRALQFEELVLWVVPENARARGLYESEGWIPDGAAREDEVLGVTVTDMRYRRSF